MSNAQIMIVEDESLIALDIQSKLENLGYFVSGIAHTGEDAIRKTLQTRPDLVLMDIMLKGSMDGTQAAARIKASLDVPIVFLTAYSDDKTLQKAKISEPFGYLLKPFKDRELQLTLEIALYKHSVQNKMKRREHWFATIVNHITDAVITTDGENFITFANTIALSMMVLKQEQVMGKAIQEVLKLNHQEQAFPLVETLQQALKKSIHTYLTHPDLKWQTPHAKEYFVEVIFSRIFDDLGQTLGNLIVIKDVTERNHAQKELYHVKEELTHSEKQLEQTSRLVKNILTVREKQIIQLIVNGQSTKDIADQLKISTRTVEAHRYNLMRKINVQDIPSLVRQAIVLKMVELS